MQRITVTIKVDDESLLSYRAEEEGMSYSDFVDENDSEEVCREYLGEIFRNPEGASPTGMDFIPDWDFDYDSGTSYEMQRLRDEIYSLQQQLRASTPSSNASSAQLDYHKRFHEGQFDQCGQLH